MTAFDITRILAATDLSDSSLPALRYARSFADRFSAKLTVVYSDPLLFPTDVIGPANAMFIAPAPEHEARLRGEAVEQVGRVMAGRPYEVEIAFGQPIPAILETAEERRSDLIVMGTHLRHGWRRALLGSISEGVVHGSRCPVLTAAADEGLLGSGVPAVTNVLCPVNFTYVSRDAVHAAARVADAFSANLIVVHISESASVNHHLPNEQTVRSWIAPELQEIVTYRELIVRDGAAERVLDCADDLGADLLVIGAQHRFFRDTTVLGTTTERLIRFAGCPVLTVPREAVRDRLHMAGERELVSAGGER